MRHINGILHDAPGKVQLASVLLVLRGMPERLRFPVMSYDPKFELHRYTPLDRNIGTSDADDNDSAFKKIFKSDFKIKMNTCGGIYARSARKLVPLCSNNVIIARVCPRRKHFFH
jgi:hypothetical protein